MMKKMQAVTVFVIILGMIICLAGCGSNNSDGNNIGGNDTAKEKIDIEDIVWTVDEGVINGNRRVSLSCTNNTQYTLTDFQITFSEKPDITEEEKEEFYSFIQELFEATNEEMEEVKEEPISMWAEAEKIIEPGESVSNQTCCYYDGIYYVQDIDHYNLVEPDIATIKYIDEDKIFTVYYDFHSKKYSAEEKTKVAYQWSKTDVGDMIPKPDVKVIENYTDSETHLWFVAYGFSWEQFDAYVEECKELGYTVEPYSYSENNYCAYNAEGDKISLDYDEDNCSMDVDVYPAEREDAPDEDDTNETESE